MSSTTETYLKNKISDDGAIHITLIDPEKTTSQSASSIARDAELFGTAAVMIGGSTSVITSHLDSVVKAVKRSVKIPSILFPNNITGISKYADAVWFMSLLNSLDPYYLSGVQILGAPLIKKFGLEPIPLGYIVVGTGGAVGVVGRATPIPHDKPELAVAHALAAQFFGMRFIYLEGGSGAKQSVPKKMIRMVKDATEIPLIIGGGIKNGVQAKKIADAGANIIVTGTLIEESNLKDNLKELVNSLKCRQNRTTK